MGNQRSSTWSRVEQKREDEVPGPLRCSRGGVMLTGRHLRGAEGRGKKPCKFAEKVWNAQNAGAVGVGASLRMPQKPGRLSTSVASRHLYRNLFF